MTITRDTGKDASNFTTSGTSISISAPGGTYDAGKLLVSCAYGGFNISQMVVPSGYTAAATVDQFGIVGLVIAYKANSAGTETGMGWTTTGGPSASDYHAAGFQYSGITTTSPFDKQNGGHSGGSQVATLGTGSTSAITSAQRLIITAMCGANGFTSPASANGTIIRNVNGKLAVAERIATGTTFSDTFTWTNNNFADAAIATFIPSTSTGGRMKVYLSGAWTTKPLKIWNGSSWVEKPVKRWNGSSWVILT